MENLSFVLALEGAAPTPDKTALQRVLDYLVRHLQPSPSMTHIELFVPSETHGGDVHFATYMGTGSDEKPYTAGWGSAFSDGSPDFYNDNREHWRAVPVVGIDTSALRKEANAHVGTPYGLWWDTVPYLYAFSVPPLRALTYWLSDKPKAPAHCATLVARILKRASTSPVLPLENPSAWYGPSTLFLELSRDGLMGSYDTSEMHSLVHTDDASALAVNTIIHESDEAVARMSEIDVKLAILTLTERVIVARGKGEATERLHQKNLAKALLRWKHVWRPHSPEVPDAEAERDVAPNEVPSVEGPDGEESGEEGGE